MFKPVDDIHDEMLNEKHPFYVKLALFLDCPRIIARNRQYNIQKKIAKKL